MAGHETAASTLDARTTRRRAAMAAAIGTLLEYYDYYLFGLASAVVFPKLFFPSDNEVAGQLASFATFAVGFLLRPIGGVVLGHIADRIGRQKALIITIVMMGGATLAIGLLPGYAQIGAWAPILLVLLRLVQGFSTGGEMGGATALIVEHAPGNRRGMYGALLLAGSGTALLIASGLMNLVSALPDPSFFGWGWRLPFLLSAGLLVAGLIIRLKVPETEAFREDQRARSTEKAKPPLLEILRRPKMLVLGVLFGVANSIGGYVLTTYGLAFLDNQGFPEHIGLTATMVAAGAQIVLAPTWGLLSDKIGRRPVFLGGCAGLALFVFPFFWMLQSGNIVLVSVAMTIGFSGFVMSMSALSQTILAELFSTRSRSTGVNLGYQLTAVLAGGFAPMIATALTAAAGGAIWAVCVYLIAGCALSAVAILVVPESSRNSLRHGAVARPTVTN